MRRKARGELLADVGAGRVASDAAGQERGAGLEHERFDLVARARQDPRDLLVRDVAELGEHEGGALIVGQVRHVGQDRAQVLPRRHLGGQTIRDGQGHLRHGALAAGAQYRQAAVAGYRVEPRPQRGGRVGAPQVAVGGEERELQDVLGLLLGAQHVPTERQDGTMVALEQRLERALRAGTHVLDQPLIGGEPQQPGWHEVVVAGQDGVGSHGVRSMPRARAGS
jgi:hypothetical protein